MRVGLNVAASTQAARTRASISRAPSAGRSIHCENSIEAERRVNDSMRRDQFVIEPRRRLELQIHLADHEHDAVRLAQFHLIHAAAAQPFGARAFEEMQISRVIDDAAGVGIFPINAHRPGK